MEQLLYHKTRYRLVLKFDVRFGSSVADASSLSKSKTPGNSNHKFITELFHNSITVQSPWHNQIILDTPSKIGGIKISFSLLNVAQN